jgi:hypothetical protein
MVAEAEKEQGFFGGCLKKDVWICLDIEVRETTGRVNST